MIDLNLLLCSALPAWSKCGGEKKLNWSHHITFVAIEWPDVFFIFSRIFYGACDKKGIGSGFDLRHII